MMNSNNKVKRIVTFIIKGLLSPIYFIGYLIFVWIIACIIALLSPIIAIGLLINWMQKKDFDIGW